MKLKYFDKYGDIFGRACEEIQQDLEGKSDEELQEIISEAKTLTIYNCSWTAYRISATVIEKAQIILQSREKTLTNTN